MTIQDLGSIGELVAAMATVAALGYLALQIRNGNEADRLNAELSLSTHLADFHARMASQPDLLRVWDEAAEDSSSLSPEDKRKYRWLIAEAFLHLRRARSDGPEGPHLAGILGSEAGFLASDAARSSRRGLVGKAYGPAESGVS